MELVWSQSSFKRCNEPLNIRNPEVRAELGIASWSELYSASSTPALERYFSGICEGRVRILNSSPRERHYRPLTRRIVFKVLHGGEDRIAWFRDQFNGRIVLLLRHPIPVALSRQQLPRLRAFLESEYRYHLTSEQRAVGDRIHRSGSRLEQAVLDWCLQTAVPLRHREPDWLVVTYEQLVLAPRPLLGKLRSQLELPDRPPLQKSLDVPSQTSNRSELETLRILRNPEGERRARYLIERWRNRVDRSQEERLMEILIQLGVSCYSVGDPLPSSAFWEGEKPEIC